MYLAEKSSFRDTDSRIVIIDDELYRLIYPEYFEHYRYFINSGLYYQLLIRDLIIEHKEVKNETGYTAIKPERISFISYPYEWSFSQLKSAALTTLEINLVALEHNMILKDASAYNIQYDLKSNHWKLIDTASFIKYKEGTPWLAYGQFIRHFLAPLLLAKYRGANSLKLLQSNIDGLIPKEISRILPIKSFLDTYCFMFLHSYRFTKNESTNFKISKQKLVNLLDIMKRYIQSLKYKTSSHWTKYETDTPYTLNKEVEIIAILRSLKQRNGLLCDIGANTGKYSKIARAQEYKVIAIDYDHDCIERLTGQGNILPLVVDITNPTPAIGWGNFERKPFLCRHKLQNTMALALIHHICIGNGVPLKYVAQILREITQENLIIEFISPEDENFKLLANRKTSFPEYSQEIFEYELGKRFDLTYQKELSNCRTIYVYSTN